MKKLLIILFSFVFTVTWARYPDSFKRNSELSGNATIDYRMDCAQAGSEIDMDVNNVRARLLSGGDVWWDLDRGLYVVPAVEPGSGIEPVSSIFAGAVWLGGFDEGDNLRLACQTYRDNNNNDFWPGPLTEEGTVEAEICRNWDRFFEVQGSEIDQHRVLFNTIGTPIPEDLIPPSVLYWPGQDNRFFEQRFGFELPPGQPLGAFFDRDGDGEYNPELGDFPQIEIEGCGFLDEDDIPYPDEMIFWIYNDAGGVHTNSNGDPINMEVQVQSFAFQSTDELNDMTFQRYRLINRATQILDSTHFAMWVDPDLGCYQDDFVGCDTSRDLAFIYNEDAVDGNPGEECFGVNTYGTNVPLLGVDYFRGPLDIDDLIEVEIPDGDSMITVLRPRILGMSSFTYFNNEGVGDPDDATTDPEVPQHFFNYLTGRWRDGTPFTVGGDGFNPGSTVNQTNFAFPDAPNVLGGWSMCEETLPFGDRRTIQASGPFRLLPGIINELIIGVPWVPDIEYPCPDLTPLLAADDLAQGLFDNCFRIIDGPDAPDVDIIELDRELVFVLTNDSLTSNNAFEEYEEFDFTAPQDVEDSLKTLRFEGYKVFQLARQEAVSITDINDVDPSQARLIYEVDLRNDVERIYNWEALPDPSSEGEFLWIPRLQNEGINEGIRKTFRVTEDQFATTNRRLVNNQNYYFRALAYGHNEYEPFDPETGLGQRRNYIVGRRNSEVVTGIPRQIVFEKLNSSFGEGPIVTRLDGMGTGSNFLSVSKEQREAMLSDDFSGEISYLSGRGPIEVQIFNPFVIEDGDYLLEFSDSDLQDDMLSEDANWTITQLSTGEVFEGSKNINNASDEIFGDLGFSVYVSQEPEVGTAEANNGGFIGANAFYEDPLGSNWFASIPDQPNADQFNFFNYVKTGLGEVDEELDPLQSFNNLGETGWNPFLLTDYRSNQVVPNPQQFVTPGYVNTLVQSFFRAQADLTDLNNVDIVFTNDKSKWSRCMVIETASRFYLNELNKDSEGDADHFQLRQAPSVGQDDADGDGLPDPDGDGLGMGWFPGYAVDVETGRRLNIFFGENSTYSEQDTAFFPDGNVNTRDMMWNPSSTIFVPNNDGTPIDAENWIAGGQHFIYVTNQNYDGCESLRTAFAGGAAITIAQQLRNVVYTVIPTLAEGEELLSYADGLIPNEYTVELRVSKPYDVSAFGIPTVEYGTGDNNFHPSYLFNFEGVASEELETGTEREDALSNVNAVPNPYYGFSAYETNEKFRVVRLTNLPPQCNVTIYSIDGRFIRSFRRNVVGMSNENRSNPGTPQDQELPYLEWDLTNYTNIPVAAGVYLIHIDAPGLGEKTIKWFGINRKFNPSNFQ